MLQTTIAAICTPQAQGGVAIVRVSGEKAKQVAKAVFLPQSGVDILHAKGYTAHFGRSVDIQGDIDEGILTVFCAPKSYTGEDVCEISCHGGLYVASRLLRACLGAGAVPAAPGEFTKRAYLNGKMSLTQAEAVADIISAQGQQALQAALAAKNGALYARVQEIESSLMDVCAHVAAFIDFPEEDVEEVFPQQLQNRLKEMIQACEALINGYDQGKIVREGVYTVIAGKPNVGKSTLMNLLSGAQKSIVTHIPGTTRDVVEETIRLGPLVLRLCDTAGIHQTSDEVERIGVDLARKHVGQAQLVLAVFDGSKDFSTEDEQLVESLQGKRAIAIVNKTDLAQALSLAPLRARFSQVVQMSAATGQNVRALQQAVEEEFSLTQFDATAAHIANERQLACIRQSLQNLQSAYEAIAAGVTLDAVEVCLTQALQALQSLNGKNTADTVVDEIFSRFCVGK